MQRTVEASSRGTFVLLALLMLPAGAGSMAGDSAAGRPSAAALPANLDGSATTTLAAAAPTPEGESGAGAPGMGTYRGTVIDRRSTKPVENATIVFINEETSDSFEAVTDAQGAYEIHLPTGQYVVDIKVKKKIYRSTGTFREEASGKRWVMDFTVGTKLTEKDFKIETTPRDIRLMPTEPRPPLEASKKLMEFFIFIGGLAVVGALAN